ncbi:MAG TPA: FeoA family protein [Balneolales bacterium]|nr:FeoA family protein [Balneolales bacterium]
MWVNMIGFKKHSSPKVRADITYPSIGETQEHITTLNDLKVSEMACITNFNIENIAVKKIEAMGLRCGEKISVLHRQGRGIIVRTNNSRIVISTDVAKIIEVK